MNQLIFSPKWCHVSLASIYHFLVLDPHLKAVGPIYGSHPIGLLYFIGPWTSDRHLKWPKPFLIVRLSKLPSWLCLFLRVNLPIYKGCEIVNSTTPNLATLGHQCYMANSSSPVDCQKCSSNGPQFKFSRLPILDIYSISAEFLQAAKFRKGLKPLSFSLSSSSRVNLMTLLSLRGGKILFFLKERKTQQWPALPVFLFMFLICSANGKGVWKARTFMATLINKKLVWCRWL